MKSHPSIDGPRADPGAWGQNKRRCTSYQGELSPAPLNLVRRNFHAESPCQLWLTDTSEFSAAAGKVYLSAMIDCSDGKVVGAKTGRNPVMELAEDTLTRALIDHPNATLTLTPRSRV